MTHADRDHSEHHFICPGRPHPNSECFTVPIHDFEPTITDEPAGPLAADPGHQDPVQSSPECSSCEGSGVLEDPDPNESPLCSECGGSGMAGEPEDEGTSPSSVARESGVGELEQYQDRQARLSGRLHDANNAVRDLRAALTRVRALADEWSAQRGAASWPQHAAKQVLAALDPTREATRPSPATRGTETAKAASLSDLVPDGVTWCGGVHGKVHSIVFDGDDPYTVCSACGERRDALTGRVITAGRAEGD